MKRMKRTLALVLVFIALLSLAACGAKAPAAEQAAAPEKLIVYTQKTMDQFFHVALQQTVEEAVVGAGYSFEVSNCNNDSSLQTSQMQNFIAKKPTAIIANAVDSDAFNDAVTAAVEAGIPVVEVDNPASTAVVDCIVAYDNLGNGKMAAETVVAKLTEKYGEPKGVVVDVYGAMSSECWRLRKEGFDAVMAEYPNIEVVDTPGEGEQAKSQDALTNVIAQRGGDIDAVYCPSDAPGLGCVEALKIANMWYKVGEEGHIILVTGDGEPDAVQGLMDGYYDGIVVEDAYAYGPMAVDMLTTYVLKGEKVPTSGTYTNENFYWKTAEYSDSARGPVLMVPPYLLDASNVDADGHWGVAALAAGK